MTFKALHEFIVKHDIITIFSHIYPDGDALGSVVGLRELIKTNFPHKEVYGLGANIAPFVHIIDETDVVSDEVIKTSGALVIDVANGDRVEDQRFKLAKDSFKVDHHIFVEKYTSGELVMTNRIATSEIIGEYMIAYNLKTSVRGATALLLGIMTDSGRFMYDLTSANTFKVVTLLMENGADLMRINSNLSLRKLESLKPRGYFLEHYETYQNVLYCRVPFSKLQELDIAPSSGGMFVNTYAGIVDYPLWATFFEGEDGIIFVELRSKNYNVQAVARKFGGGGHLKASGCRINSKDEIELVLKALTEAEQI